MSAHRESLAAPTELPRSIIPEAIDTESSIRDSNESAASVQQSTTPPGINQPNFEQEEMHGQDQPQHNNAARAQGNSQGKGCEQLDEIGGLLWEDLTPIRQLACDHLLKRLLMVVCLVLVVSYLEPWWRWANTPVALVMDTHCPIHSGDYMQARMVPTQIQTGFGKAAWMLPRHWEDWMENPPFQSLGGLMPLYSPSNATLPREQVHRIDKSIADYRQAITGLPDLANSSEVPKTVAALEDVVEILRPCIGDQPEHAFGVPTYQDPNLSAVCKGNIFFRWHNFLHLVKVMENTGRLLDWTVDEIEAVEATRSRLANVTQELGTARTLLSQELEVKIATLARGAVRFSAFWELPFESSVALRREETWSGRPTSFAMEFNHLDRIQNTYVYILWADYLVQVMDHVLMERIRRLRHVYNQVDRLEADGARDTVRHLFNYSAWHAARHGMIDVLPVKALGVFKDVETLAKAGEQQHYRAAACSWTQEHMPLHVSCSFNTTKRGKRWHILRMTEDELIEQAEERLRHYFWEELDYTKVHWDMSTEAGERNDTAEVKWRWLDIRTHQSCRLAGSEDRPYNP